MKRTATPTYLAIFENPLNRLSPLHNAVADALLQLAKCKKGENRTHVEKMTKDGLHHWSTVH